VIDTRAPLSVDTLLPAPAPVFAFVKDPLERAEYLRMDPPALRALWPRARVLWVDADGRALGNLDAPQLYNPNAKSTCGCGSSFTV